MHIENINGVNRAVFGPEKGIKQDETKLSREELKARLDVPGMSKRAYLGRYVGDCKQLQELEENHASPDSIKDTNVEDWFKEQKMIDNLHKRMDIQLELFEENFPGELPLNVLADERMVEEHNNVSTNDNMLDIG